MADNIRHIPERFGPVQRVWHPRISSMGRRILACLPAAFLGLVCLVMLWMRRPTPAISAIIVVVILVCIALCWVWLRPNTVAVTATHVLGSRAVGFSNAAREKARSVVVVESLERPGFSAQRGGKAPKRGFARPYLWLVDHAGKPIFRLDGTVWDARSMNELADQLGVAVNRIQRVEPKELAQAWPKLVTPLMRYPWIKSVFTGALLVGTVAAVYWLAWNA
ncbi:hypothetical protein [Kocuria sp.]|uniref:hypothetical protein n=1 Tax=Kocuria sp. TaxID=1871328 RepID=UPI0026DEF854|nr:hypothetical protein [Kocuria sp.]MDO5618625.1 hypothetical protein [Kocuria sp.]